MEIYQFTTGQGQTIEFDKHALCCIIQLPIDLDDVDDMRFLGTGFYFMSNSTIITAKHLFTDADENYGPHFVFNFASNGDSGRAQFLAIPREIRTHRAYDMAMIRIDPNQAPEMKPFLPGRHDFALEDGLVTIGYKPPIAKLGTGHLNCRIEVNHVTAVLEQERERVGTPTEFLLEYDAPLVTPGNSGGPVLNRAGRVVGVAVQQFAASEASDGSEPKTMGRATTLKPYLDLGRQGNLPFITPEIRDWILGDFQGEPGEIWPQVEQEIVRLFNDPDKVREMEKLEEEIQRTQRKYLGE